MVSSGRWRTLATRWNAASGSMKLTIASAGPEEMERSIAARPAWTALRRATHSRSQRTIPGCRSMRVGIPSPGITSTGTSKSREARGDGLAQSVLASSTRTTR